VAEPGQRTTHRDAVVSGRRLREEGIAGDIYLFKNNTDSAGNSYGCHENYLVGRHGEFGRLADILIPFLVTRQVICGAGKVLQTPRGAVYCVSQRAEHIWESVSSATTRSRPIINTRDEPHADAERFRRLHVIVGDSNMSETTTLLKVGATDLVLRMIEAGAIMRDLTLDNAIRAIREVSHDMTGRSRIRLANGRELGAAGQGRADLQHLRPEHAAERRPRGVELHRAGAARRGTHHLRRRLADPIVLLCRRHGRRPDRLMNSSRRSQVR
jgi:proteasome accessory factor A